MNAGTIFNARRRMVVLMIAAVVALSAAYAPVLLDEVASGNTNLPALAGPTNSDGGGG